MQSVCRLSRRWHQQFCHSPALKAYHQSCVRTFLSYEQTRGLRQVRKPLSRQRHVVQEQYPESLGEIATNEIPVTAKAHRTDDGIVVREYEQLGSDESTRRPENQDDGIDAETAEVQAEMTAIDRELEGMKDGPFGPQSELMQQLTPEDRAKVLKILQEDGVVDQDGQLVDIQGDADHLDFAEIERQMEEEHEEIVESDNLRVELDLPPTSYKLVSNFNKALSEVRQNPEDRSKSLNLWKWYLRCQQKVVANFSSFVPDKVWTALWKSQTESNIRPDRLIMLARDMQAAGYAMSTEQTLQYVEALVETGKVDVARRIWDDTRPQVKLEDGRDLFSSFFSVGIQLCAALQEPQRAQNIGYTAVEKGALPYLIVQVIVSWARSPAPDALARAWLAYLRLIRIRGNDIQMDHYDQISSALLESGHKGMATIVFKDMIAKVRNEDLSNRAHYENILQRSGDLLADSSAEELINTQSLTMLQALPQRYQNKYFYASWIKKLLGENKPDSAAMVVDLMHERNIKPDPMHLNGIIGAWLRDGSSESRERAEKLAWEMISTRVRQMQDRAQNSSLAAFGNLFRKVTSNTDHHLLSVPCSTRSVPAANVETFSLLFDYNEQRHRWHEFERLTQIMLGAAQLKPSIFIINKWLALELQQGSLPRFWSLYNGLRYSIDPNLETFSLTFYATNQTHKPRSDPPRPVEPTESRKLFKDLATWYSSLSPRQKSAARADYEPSFAQEAISSFTKSLDLQGTLLALIWMNMHLSAVPDENIIRLITGMVARLLPQPAPAPGPIGPGSGRGSLKNRLLRSKLLPNRTLLTSIADVIESIESRHKFTAVDSGRFTAEDMESEDSDASKSVRMEVMTEFLCAMLVRTSARKGQGLTREVEKVGEGMGVGVRGGMEEVLEVLNRVIEEEGGVNVEERSGVD